MLLIVIVMLKSASGVVRRINVNAFYLSGKVLFKCTKRKEIVAVNEHIARPRFSIGKRVGFDLPKTIFRGFK